MYIPLYIFFLYVYPCIYPFIYILIIYTLHYMYIPSCIYFTMYTIYCMATPLYIHLTLYTFQHEYVSIVYISPLYVYLAIYISPLYICNTAIYSIYALLYVYSIIHIFHHIYTLSLICFIAYKKVYCIYIFVKQSIKKSWLEKKLVSNIQKEVKTGKYTIIYITILQCDYFLMGFFTVFFAYNFGKKEQQLSENQAWN